ncbi:MAG: dTDP-4-dehydrorhamnose reductase [Rhodospirillaceae bacterium]
MSCDILVTGAGGQVAWELERRAAAAKLSLQALGIEALDITDTKAVHATVSEAAPKVVINAAAYTAVDKAETEKDLAFAVNRDGPGHLAAACAARDIPLVHISTDYVFDGQSKDPYREDDATAPLGVYGASKLAGEAAVRAFLDRHIIIRTAWVYGVHGHNFVKTMLRLGAERDSLRVVADQRGAPTFAGDLADALLVLSRRLIDDVLPEEAYGTFHYTGGGAVSWHGFAETIFEIAAPTLGRRPKVDAITTAEYPTPAKRPANSVLDCSKISRIHGIMRRPWEASLQEMLAETLAAN